LAASRPRFGDPDADLTDSGRDRRPGEAAGSLLAFLLLPHVVYEPGCAKPTLYPAVTPPEIQQDYYKNKGHFAKLP